MRYAIMSSFCVAILAVAVSGYAQDVSKDQDGSAPGVSHDGGENVQTGERKTPLSTEARVVAEVGMVDVHIIEQRQNQLLMEMTLTNGKGAQPDVHYAAQLVKKTTEEDDIIIYQHIFDRKIALAENGSYYEKFTFDIPARIAGEYLVRVVASTGDGMMLATTQVDTTVTLTGDDKPYVMVDELSCRFFVRGDDADYAPDQGVDVAATETLAMTCGVHNAFDTDVTVHPVITTYQRSLFGSVVAVQDETKDVTIPAGTRTELTFDITKPSAPQAYSMAVVLMDADKNELSNTTYGHYVVQGTSASILNVQLDKTSYQKDEPIVVRFAAVPSADNFSTSRRGGQMEDIYYTLFVEDRESGEMCGDPLTAQKVEPADGLYMSATLHSAIACPRPAVSLSLENDKGDLLAQGYFDFTPTPEESVRKGTEEKRSIIPAALSTKTFAVMIAGILTLISFAAILAGVWRKKSFSRTLRVLVICGGVSGGLVMITSSARAATLQVAPALGDVVTCDFNLSKTQVSPGECFTGSTSGCRVTYCGNKFRMTATINGQTVSSWARTHNLKKGLYKQEVAGGTATICAPQECGRYTVPIGIDAGHFRDSLRVWNTAQSWGELGYEVTNCTLNADMTSTVRDCGDGAQKSGIALVSITNVTGVSGSATEYRFSCGDGQWSGWGSASTKECTFKDPGVKTIYGEVRRNGVMVSKTVTVTIPPCSLGKPSCSLSFSPKSGKVPFNGSVTLSAQNAVGSGSATCTGSLVPNGRNTVDMTFGVSYPQSYSTAGSKSCTATVKNAAGVTATCSGSLTVGTSTPPSTPPTCTPNCSCADRLTTQESCSNGCGGMCYGRLSPAVCGSASGQTFDRPLTYFDDLCRSGKPMQLAPEQGRWAWTCWTSSRGAFCYADSSTPTVFCGTEKDTCVYGTLSKPAILCDVEKNKAIADGYEEARKNHMQKVRKECEDRWGRLYAERERCIRAGGHLYTTRDQTKSFSSKNTYVWAEMQKMYGRDAMWSCSLHKNSVYLWQCVGPDSPWHGKDSGARNWCFAPVGCTGTLPPGAVKCPDAETGATGDMAWQRVDTCVAGQRCAYTNTQDCSGDKRSVCPEDETAMCDGDTTGKTTVAGQGWVRRDTFGECTTDRACECYTKTATDTTEDDKQTDEHGRMIETRP